MYSLISKILIIYYIKLNTYKKKFFFKNTHFFSLDIYYNKLKRNVIQININYTLNP